MRMGESELRLADVINFLPDATLVIDARDGSSPGTIPLKS